MKKVHKAINKNIRMLLIIAAATVVALAVLLMLIAGNEERNQIPTDPTKASETKESEAPTDVNETTVPTQEEGVSQQAQLLYDARVDDINNSAAVAKLLETIDLRKNVASYQVTLLVKDSPKSMVITFDKTISEAERQAFDEKMQNYAEQILALTNGADQVQWVYTVKGEDKKKEERNVYLDGERAKELLKNDVKKYGTSAKAVQNLLNQQNRKDVR